MDNLYPFGRAVKIALINQGHTQKWLIEAVRADTGQFVDSGYMSKILSGQRKPPKILASIAKNLGLALDKEPKRFDKRESEQETLADLGAYQTETSGN